MLKGGITSFEVVLTRDTDRGGGKKFPPFKRGEGRENVYPVLSVCVWGWGGGAKRQSEEMKMVVSSLPMSQLPSE